MSMPLEDLAPAFLVDSSHGILLANLYVLYRALDLAIEDWQRASRLLCPPACGTCCATYEPTVLPIEGMAVAAYAAQGHPATAPLLDSEPSVEALGCVFYDPGNARHCTVYVARPLECRLFAFSAVRDKDSRPVYRLCRHMPGPGPRTTGTETLRERYGALPPTMQDYSARLQALSGGSSRRLREEARAAWRTVCLLRALAAGERLP